MTITGHLFLLPFPTLMITQFLLATFVDTREDITFSQGAPVWVGVQAFRIASRITRNGGY